MTSSQTNTPLRRARLRSSSTVRVARLTTLVTVAAAAGLVVARDYHAPRSAPAFAVIAIGLCFLAAEQFPIHLPIGTERHTMSFNEVAIAAGLVYLAPIALVIAALLGSGFVLVAHRHQRGVKLLFNLAQLSAQAVLSVIVFHALGGAPLGVALAAAVLSADTLSTVLVSGAIALHQGSLRGVLTRRVLAVSTAEGVAKSFVAACAVTVLTQHVALGLVLLVAGAISYVAYRDGLHRVRSGTRASV